MSVLTLSGIFLLIIIIKSSPFLINNNSENQCVLRDIKCKPHLQRPCCHQNDYCKQVDSDDSFRCTEKNLEPALGRFCETHEDCDKIWHSKCLENKCVCRENNVKFNETACGPILGGFCWRNETCLTENTICINQECRCKKNHTQVMNKCIFNVLGTHCENDETCQQVKFAKCSKKKICSCPRNALQVNQYCKSPIDGFCWSKDDCSTTLSICDDNKCKCEPGMVFYDNTCVKVFMNMPCLKDRECSSYMPFSKCSSAYRCTCEAYYSEHRSRCVPDPVNFCISNYSCKLKYSICNKAVCECSSGFVYRQNLCVSISVDDSCVDNNSCHPIKNGKCSIDKKCVCEENHIRLNKSSCIPMLGGNCKQDNDCIIANSTCSNSYCQCKPNFVNRTESECLLVRLGMNCRYDDDCRAIENSECSDRKVCECIKNSVKLNSTACFLVFGTSHRPVCLNKNTCRSNDGSKTHKTKYKQSFKKIECMEHDDCKQISNAKCIDFTCSCKEHYAMINNATCAPLLGQYCRLQEQCATPNSECIDKKCRCEAGYVNYFNNICVSKAGNFGISCKNDYYCIYIKYSECSDEKKCACKSNYVALGDDQCLALIGEYCDSDSECISYNTVCVDHKCKCPEKFVMRSKYQCDRISLGRICEMDHDCQIAMNNSICSEDNVCICKKNHYALSNFECVPYLHEKCATDDDCRFNFSACIDNKCQCTLLYRSVSLNQCELFGSLYGCEENLDCGDPWHNVCSADKKCICNKNNTYIDKSTCSPLLGGYCWIDHQCVVRNSMCVDFHCKCRNDFRPVSSNMCMPIKQ